MCSPSEEVEVPIVKPIVFHQVGNYERVKCQFKFPQSRAKPTISQYIYNFNLGKRSPKEVPINYCFHKGAFHIYRYENPYYLNAMLKNREIAFIRPNLWTDPFEAKFYEPNKIIKSKKYDVACVCVKYDWIAGEESAWQSYGKNIGQVVRVEYNFAQYAKLLNKIGEENDVNFYISVVDYSIRRAEIVSLFYKQKGQFSSIEEYLTYLSLKRDAFSHENELRIFAVKKGQSFEDNSSGVVKFDFSDIISDQELIKSVGSDDDNSTLITEVALSPNINEINKLQTTINTINPNFSFYHSKLYDTSTQQDCDNKIIQ